MCTGVIFLEYQSNLTSSGLLRAASVCRNAEELSLSDRCSSAPSVAVLIPELLLVSRRSSCSRDSRTSQIVTTSKQARKETTPLRRKRSIDELFAAGSLIKERGRYAERMRRIANNDNYVHEHQP